MRPPTSSAALQNEPSFWQKNSLKVFVLHLSDYRVFAVQLKKALLPLGISCFVAHEDIEPTTEWQNQIEIALWSCDALIALLHPKFRESNWTDQEIGFVMGRGAPAFAVRFGETPYGFIGRFQAFRGSEKSASELARELFDAFRKHEGTRYRMGEALICLFEESTSYANARELIGHLEDLQHWEPSYAERIRAAAKTNSQIYDSWGVASRVSSLANRWESELRR